jgi:hypothetical protein
VPDFEFGGNSAFQDKIAEPPQRDPELLFGSGPAVRACPFELGFGSSQFRQELPFDLLARCERERGSVSAVRVHDRS